MTLKQIALKEMIQIVGSTPVTFKAAVRPKVQKNKILALVVKEGELMADVTSGKVSDFQSISLNNWKYDDLVTVYQALHKTLA